MIDDDMTADDLDYGEELRCERLTQLTDDDGNLLYERETA